MEKALQHLDPSDYFPEDSKIRIFHHPDLLGPARELENLPDFSDLRGHFGVFSSGTSTTGLKAYVHSRSALESNARAVNEFFQLTASDTWALSLPDYHIGGLQVLLRAKLSGAAVVDARGWEPQRWAETLRRSSAVITSIVPTQLYDLLENRTPVPPALRYLIVGGDFLSPALEKKARSAGWPVLRTFGMTEVGSQIASAKPGKSDLEVLSIHELKVTEEQHLAIRSPALFAFECRKLEAWKVTPAKELIDADGFYLTQDTARIDGNSILPLGRSGDSFKSGGHLIRLGDLRANLQSILLAGGLFGRAEIHLLPDARKGKKIVLVHEGLQTQTLDAIRSSLAPVRVDEVRLADKIHKTDLGKSKNLS